MIDTAGSIISEDEYGNKIEEVLFTYSESERQQQAINAANAQRAFSPEFIPYYPAIAAQGCSYLETLLYGFIRFYTSFGNGKFYFSNEQLSGLFKVSERQISSSLTVLTEKKLLKTSFKIKSGGGKIRFCSVVVEENFQSDVRVEENFQSERKKTSTLTRRKPLDYINNNKINNNKINNNKYVGTSDEVRLALYLFHKIKEQNPYVKEPDIQKWANHIGLMIRVDTIPKERIEKMIDWAKQDPFWSKNILSTESLRKHFAKMYEAAKSDYHKQQKEEEERKQRSFTPKL